MFDLNDDTFTGDTPTAIAPIATTKVTADSTYSIGFIPEGDYTVALSCGSAIDHNILYDSFIIPSSAGNSQTITLTRGTTTSVDF